MTQEIEPQLNAFLKGFYYLIPSSFLTYLTPSDLGIMISGSPTIDFKEMKQTAQYEGCSKKDRFVKWFWEIVKAFNQEELASLLFFISGIKKKLTNVL